jgi:broad specificity phosphatase PhoE
MTTLILLRHGRAAAGWDTAMDPPLDELGRAQADNAAQRLRSMFAEAQMATAEIDVVTSPLLRCQQTAAALSALIGREARIEQRIAEIPSPEGVAMEHRVSWLREAMQGTWSDIVARNGDTYARFHEGLIDWARTLRRPTVAFSHFVAINALIGAAIDDDRVVIRRLDNASITTLHVSAEGVLRLVQGGDEADTLIR